MLVVDDREEYKLVVYKLKGVVGFVGLNDV